MGQKQSKFNHTPPKSENSIQTFPQPEKGPLKLPHLLLFRNSIQITRYEMVNPPRTAKINFVELHKQIKYYPRYTKYIVHFDKNHKYFTDSGIFYRGIPMDITKFNKKFILVENAYLRSQVKMSNKIRIPFPLQYDTMKPGWETNLATKTAILNQFKQQYLAVVYVQNDPVHFPIDDDYFENLHQRYNRIAQQTAGRRISIILIDQVKNRVLVRVKNLDLV